MIETMIPKTAKPMPFAIPLLTARVRKS